MENNTHLREKTFQQTYEQCAGQIRNFLYYKIGNYEKACDITQESFERYWVNFHKVNVGKEKNYLFTIAYRLFLDDVDRQKVQLKYSFRTSGKTGEEMDNNPEYLYRQEEFKNRLESAITELPDQRRTIFLMSRIDKMKNREIAELLGISIKTVEKNISQALKQLKTTLSELVSLNI